MPKPTRPAFDERSSNVVFIPTYREQLGTGATTDRRYAIFGEVFDGTDLELVDVELMTDSVLSLKHTFVTG